MSITKKVSSSFSQEWKKFTYDEHSLSEEELEGLFKMYFEWLFKNGEIKPDALVADYGCGSGRWTKKLASYVKKIDAFDLGTTTLAVARKNCENLDNVEFFQQDLQTLDANEKYDFVYSLGVLHHIENTELALRNIVKSLKPNGRAFFYFYYALEGKSAVYKALWRVSNYLRMIIARLPRGPRMFVCEVIALLIYYPLARTAKIFSALGFHVGNWPLYFYRNLPLYVMRTDALDRFGTILEKRFTRGEIERMLRASGLGAVRFSSEEPYWKVVGCRNAK